jgi:hypothetical protein
MVLITGSVLWARCCIGGGGSRFTDKKRELAAMLDVVGELAEKSKHVKYLCGIDVAMPGAFSTGPYTDSQEYRR